jgi:HEAT repeat protein
MKPGMQTALKMHDMAELGQFVEMKQNEQLRLDAERILDLMTRAARQRRRDIGVPDQLVEDFQSDDLTVYGKAQVQLSGHGPYAVPHVVHLLVLEGAGQQGVVAHAISLLANMHRDACLPLVRVLRGTDDPLLQSRVAGVLGQIGDARAVPALMATIEDPDSGDQAKGEAAEAVVSITGQSPAELGSAAEQYVALAKAYFKEYKPKAGYTYGLTADVWEWDPAGEELRQKVTYEEVPNYLYYQRMATEVALDGLAIAPGDKDLQALLAASLVRQLARCAFFKSEDIRLGGVKLEAEIKQDAAERAAEFEVEVPLALNLLEAPVLAQALQMVLSVEDGPASLYLAKALSNKIAASGPGALDADTAAALIAALDSGDKDVRYEAAVTLVRANPTGADVPAEETMRALGAALMAAADRNALVIMDNFQVRNRLVTLLRKAGAATTESNILEPRVEGALSLEPSVDIVFLSSDVPALRFERVVRLLAKDPRTKSAPLYMVALPVSGGPELAQYTEVEAFLSPDDLIATKLQPILDEKVFAESRSLFTEDEEALVLRAAEALAPVNPLDTMYPLALLEPALTRALTGYKEEVSLAAVAALAKFGSEQSIEPLSGLVVGDASLGLKVAACRAMAAVLKRTETGLPEEVLAVLKDAMAGDEQALREAAAEALSGGGLSAEDVLLQLRTEALGEQ